LPHCSRLLTNGSAGAEANCMKKIGLSAQISFDLARQDGRRHTAAMGRTVKISGTRIAECGW
jgi:hypothetical protein